MLRSARRVLGRLKNRPRAPLPAGPLTGRRGPWRRRLGAVLAAANRLADRLPPGRWWHRRVLRSLVVERHRVVLARPEAPAALRTVYLSDLHAGNFLDAADLARLGALVRAEEPDLVLFGGDLINTRPRELELYAGMLADLSPPLGVHAAPGNHDRYWGGGLEAWTARLEEFGVEVLCNRGRRLEAAGGTLWLAGVDDLTEGEPDLPQALAGWDEDEPCLVLSHHPDFFVETAAVGVDLTLAGHTHGGQVRFGSWIPLEHSRFGWHGGFYEREGARLYVGRGVGTTLLPIRIGAPPEIAVFDLVRGP